MSHTETVVVTGGAGFIGSALIRHLIAHTSYKIVNIDKLTYAANLKALEDVEGDNQYIFAQEDIADAEKIRAVLTAHKPIGIFNLAAESHVDRSIDGPSEFIKTNILGTFTLLQEALRYWGEAPAKIRDNFRFLQVSTDEVFGSLGSEGLFSETTPYDPSSPYSASKAAADHLVRAWHRTYGLPVLITNCSNNYGPWQFPEKLIPLMITRALRGDTLPVYGDGQNVRDWLYVEDHVRALALVFGNGRTGETYAVGGRNERTNIEMVHDICDCLDRLQPLQSGNSRRSLIRFVADRPGHDRRYAIDPSKIETELDWRPLESGQSGIEKTVEWYVKAEKSREVPLPQEVTARLGLGPQSSFI